MSAKKMRALREIEMHQNIYFSHSQNEPFSIELDLHKWETCGEEKLLPPGEKY